jgi:hypothetical protein
MTYTVVELGISRRYENCREIRLTFRAMASSLGTGAATGVDGTGVGVDMDETRG